MKFISSIFIMLTLFSCLSEKEKLVHITGNTMGTYYSVKVVGSNIVIEDLKIQVDGLLKEVNNVFSTYIDDSELSRLNKNQSLTPIKITPVLADVLKLSKEIYKSSDGAFDVTVGPLVNMWGFGPDKIIERPTDEEIKKKMKAIGSDNFKIIEDSIVKSKENLYIDLSAIAKGQAVDDVALVLANKGFKSFLVEIGGEVRAQGQKPDGSKWRVGIEKPSKQLGQAIQKVVVLDKMSIATSGGYRNYLKYGDEVFSHTINPKTGTPVEHKLVSVSVLNENCAVADAWATAFMVLGAEKGLDIANRLGLKAYFLVKTDEGFKEIQSSLF
jgi:thiamine biosynthesis lipoprotein